MLFYYSNKKKRMKEHLHYLIIIKKLKHALLEKGPESGWAQSNSQCFCAITDSSFSVFKGMLFVFFCSLPLLKLRKCCYSNRFFLIGCEGHFNFTSSLAREQKGFFYDMELQQRNKNGRDQLDAARHRLAGQPCPLVHSSL